MRLLIRFMGLSMIGMIYLVMFMEMMYKDVLSNELNVITSLAMNQTQIVMTEQIEDLYYHTNNARKKFYSNYEYASDFVDNLEKLKSSDARYEIEIHEADIEEGILDVNVIVHYKRINGDDVSLSTRKTMIVDVLMRGDEST